MASIERSTFNSECDVAVRLSARAYVYILISPRIDTSWSRRVSTMLLMMIVLVVCHFSFISTVQLVMCTGSGTLHEVLTGLLLVPACMPAVIFLGTTYDSRGVPRDMRAGSMRARAHMYLLSRDANWSAMLCCLSLMPLIVYSTCMALTCPNPRYDELLFDIMGMVPGAMMYWLLHIYTAKLKFFRAVADRELAWRVLVSEPRCRRR